MLLPKGLLYCLIHLAFIKNSYATEPNAVKLYSLPPDKLAKNAAIETPTQQSQLFEKRTEVFHNVTGDEPWVQDKLRVKRQMAMQTNTPMVSLMQGPSGQNYIWLALKLSVPIRSAKAMGVQTTVMTMYQPFSRQGFLELIIEAKIPLQAPFNGLAGISQIQNGAPVGVTLSQGANGHMTSSTFPVSQAQAGAQGMMAKKGFINLMLNLNLPLGAMFSGNLITDLQIGIFDRELVMMSNFLMVQYPNLVPTPFDCNLNNRLRISFSLTVKVLALHRLQLVFVHSSTLQETRFFAQVDGLNNVRFDIDMALAASMFNSVNGRYHIKMMMPSAAFTWHLADVILTFGAASMAYLSTADLDAYRSTFHSSLTSMTDLAGVFAGVTGLALLGKAVTSLPQDPCAFAAAQANPHNLEQLYYAAGIAQRMKCTLNIANMQQTLQGAIRVGASSHDLFYAASAMAALGMTVDYAMLEKATLQATQMDTSAMSLGFGCRVAAQLPNISPPMVGLVEQAMMQAQVSSSVSTSASMSVSASASSSLSASAFGSASASSSSYLSFQGGVTATAVIATGVMMLAQKSQLPPSINPNDITRMSNYLVEARPFQNPMDACQTVQALSVMSQNKMNVPVAISMASPLSVVPGQAPVIRVGNVLSQPLPGQFDVMCESIMEVTTGKVIMVNKPLIAFPGDTTKTMFQMPPGVLPPGMTAGNYKMAIGIQSSDQRIVRQHQEVAMKVANAVAIEGIQLSIGASVSASAAVAAGAAINGGLGGAVGTGAPTVGGPNGGMAPGAAVLLGGTGSADASASASATASASVSASASASANVMKLAVPGIIPPPMTLDANKPMSMSFSRMPNMKPSPGLNTNQAFVTLTNSVTKKEVTFVAQADASGKFNFNIDFIKVSAAMAGVGTLSGLYHMRAGIGSPHMPSDSNPNLWHVSDVNLNFPPIPGVPGIPSSPLIPVQPGMPGAPVAPGMAPNGQPSWPSGQPILGPNNSPTWPSGQPLLGPTGSPLGPTGQPIMGPGQQCVPCNQPGWPTGPPSTGPNGQPQWPGGKPVLGPNGQPQWPNGQPIMGPNKQPNWPSGQLCLGPNGEAIGPTGQPILEPNGTPLGPNGSPFSPNGSPAALGTPTSPSGIRPDGQPSWPTGQPIIGPNNRPQWPSGQPLVGPNGSPMGPTGQPLLGPNASPVPGPNGQPMWPRSQPSMGPNGQPQWPGGKPLLGPNKQPLWHNGQPILGPNGKPSWPSGQPCVGPTGQALGPNGQPVMGPNKQPLSPSGTPVVPGANNGPTGSPVGPNGQPTGNPMGPNGKPNWPSGQPVLGSNNVPSWPNGKPMLGPSGSPLGPTGQPLPAPSGSLGPNGAPAFPNGLPTTGPNGFPRWPSGQPLNGPSGKPQWPNAQPIVNPNGQPQWPNGQPCTGPNGQAMGPNGQPILLPNGQPMGPNGQPIGAPGTSTTSSPITPTMQHKPATPLGSNAPTFSGMGPGMGMGGSGTQGLRGLRMRESVDYMTQVEMDALKVVFQRTISSGLASLPNICYAASGLKMLGATLPNPTGLCSLVKSRVEASNIESLFYATSAAAVIGSCQISTPTAATVLKSAITSSSSTTTLFQAAASMTNLGLKVDNSQLDAAIMASVKKETNAQNIAYAFHASMFTEKVNPELLALIPKVLSQTVEVDNIYMHYPQGLFITAHIITGIYLMSIKANVAPPVAVPTLMKITNYLLSRQNIKETLSAYSLLRILHLLANNPFHIPVILNLASPMTPTSGQPGLTFRIANTLGKSLTISTATVDSISNLAAGTAIMTTQNLKLSQSDSTKTLYDMSNFAEPGMAKGLYKVGVVIQSSDTRLVGIEREVSVRMASKIAIQNIVLNPTSTPATLPGMGLPNGMPIGPNDQPIMVPNGQPVMGPNGQPGFGPNGQPIMGPKPAVGPNGQPIIGPNGKPAVGQNGQPTMGPNGQPTTGTNGQPVAGPNGKPAMGPNGQPIGSPTGMPGSANPAVNPATGPTGAPMAPTSGPMTGAPLTPMKMEFGKLQSVKINTQSMYSFSFKRQEGFTSQSINANQAFVTMTHAVSKKEITFTSRADAKGMFTFNLNFMQAANRLDYSPGQYQMSAGLGSPLPTNPYVWHLADADLDFMDKPQRYEINDITTRNLQQSAPYFSTSQLETVKQTFTSSLNKWADLNTLYYSVAGLKALQQPLPDAQMICGFLKARLNAKPTVEQIYHASAAAQIIGNCVLPVSNMQATLQAAITTRSTTQQVYFAAQAMKTLGMQVNSQQVQSTMMSIIDRDSSAASLSYAYKSAKVLNLQKFELTDTFERAVTQAIQSNEYLQYDAGLATTALMISGIYTLAQTAKVPPPFSAIDSVKFANYLLNGASNLAVPRIAYSVVQALQMLSSNSYHIPVVLNMASPISMSPSMPNLMLRMTNPFGQPLPAGTTLVLEAATHLSTGQQMLQSRQELTAVSGQAGIYQLANFMDMVKERGAFTLAFLVQSSDQRLAGTRRSISVNIAQECGINNAQLLVQNPLVSGATSTNMLPYQNMVPPPISIDTTRIVSMKFGLKQGFSAQQVNTNKAFVLLTNAATGQQMVFQSQLDSSKMFNFNMNFMQAGSAVGMMSGQYYVQAGIGENITQSQYLWHLAYVNLQFNQIINEQMTTVSQTKKVLGSWTYLNQPDMQMLQNIFLMSLQNPSDLGRLFYGVAGLRLLNIPTVNPSLCNTIKSKVLTSDVESIYYAASAAALLNCQQAVTGVETVLRSAISSSSSTERIFFAVSALSSLGLRVEQTQLLNALTAAVAASSAPMSLAYAFKAAAFLTSPSGIVHNQMHQILSQAVRLDNSLLKFDGGLSVTSNVFSSIYELSMKWQSPPPLQQGQITMITNYLLSHDVPGDSRSAYLMLQALQLMTRNQYHLPVSVSLASSFTPTLTMPNVIVRVVDLLGQPLTSSVQVFLERVVQSSTGSVIMERLPLGPAMGDSTRSLYQMNFFDLVREKGMYQMAFSVMSSDMRLIGTYREVSIQVASESAVQLAEITSLSAQSATIKSTTAAISSSSPIQLMYPQLIPAPIQLDSFARSKLRFMLSQSFNMHLTNTQQAFLIFAHSYTAKEFILTSKLDLATRSYSFDVNFQLARQSIDLSSGLYQLKVGLGSATLMNSYVWHLADVDLLFAEEERAVAMSKFQ